MIVALGIILSIMACIYGIKKSRTVVNPLTIFCGVWIFVLIFSALHLYGLYETDEAYYTFIVVGIVCYILGYLFYESYFKRFRIRIGNRRRRFKDSEKTILRYRMMYMILMLCCMYYTMYLFKVFQNVSEFNLWAVQQYLRRTGTNELFPRLLRLMGAIVVGPVSFAAPAINAADLWFGEKDKKLTILTVAMITIKMLATANRTTLMSYIVFVIIDGIILIKRKGGIDSFVKPASKKRIKRVVKAIFLCGVIAFVVMSLSRNLEIGKSLYLDFAIPPKMFELWAKQSVSENVLGYGMTSLNGFLFPFAIVIEKIFRLSSMPFGFQEIYDLIARTDSHWIYPGSGITANAYVSIFWFLYVDARIFGIVAGMFLFGTYCANAYIKMIKCYTTKKVCLYSMCLLTVLYSICRMEFALANFSLAMIFIWIAAYKNKGHT